MRPVGTWSVMWSSIITCELQCGFSSLEAFKSLKWVNANGEIQQMESRRKRSPKHKNINFCRLATEYHALFSLAEIGICRWILSNAQAIDPKSIRSTAALEFRPRRFNFFFSIALYLDRFKIFTQLPFFY
jgi:hypothetical protein